jgi:SsrA-binding protein
MKKSKTKTVEEFYSKNKKAFHDYEILEKFEAGIVLVGDEVKAIKGNQANLKGSFVDVWKDEAFLNNMHVSRYKQSNNGELDPVRVRKLILHKKEILKIETAITQKGVTCIPLEIYPKKGLVKIQIGICRGKKLYDKRESLKKRDQQIEIDRQIKRYS